MNTFKVTTKITITIKISKYSTFRVIKKGAVIPYPKEIPAYGTPLGELF